MDANKETIRIAILSDLHVGQNDKNSFLTCSTPDTPHENPFFSLMQFLEKENIQADILLCCGDMADQANEAGQLYAWRKIQELSTKLNVKHLFGTVGNHDMDSRLENTFDPKGNLQKLNPAFPHKEDSYNNHYWAKNFAFFAIEETVQLLNINSCAFHGYSSQNFIEHNHGRISQFTLDKIELDLQTRKEKEYEINIAFSHHHPMKSTTRCNEDYSEMDGGDRLIKLLSKSEYGSWIIIHGHKHLSNLQIAAGDSNAPIIFSAGSFSSKRLYGENGSYKNQFYILEIYRDSMNKYELPIAGKFFVWNWSNGVGWSKAHFDDGIPYGAGFGSIGQPSVLAKKVAPYILGKPYVTWAELINEFKELMFILPKVIVDMCNKLEKSYGCKIMYDELQWPSQFSRNNTATEGDS